jgi:hypothetical protein
MKSWFTIGVLAGTLFLLFPDNAGAADPADQCTVAKLKAISKDMQCLVEAGEKAVKKNLSAVEEQELNEQCKEELIESFEDAEARANAKGGQCPTVGDAVDVHNGLATACCPLCGCQ